MKIPPGTQTGQKLRLRDKGVPSAAHEGKRGDEIVEVKIVVPKVQDERSKEILRELAKLNPEDPRAELLAEAFEGGALRLCITAAKKHSGSVEMQR